jgi:hypothetical protein
MVLAVTPCGIGQQESQTMHSKHQYMNPSSRFNDLWWSIPEQLCYVGNKLGFKLIDLKVT